MSQLAKTLAIPEIESVTDIEGLKKYLRALAEVLQQQHRFLRNDINQIEAMYFVLSGVRWRLLPVGNDFQIQKLVSGTWTTAFTIVGT